MSMRFVDVLPDTDEVLLYLERNTHTPEGVHVVAKDTAGKKTILVTIYADGSVARWAPDEEFAAKHGLRLDDQGRVVDIHR